MDNTLIMSKSASTLDIDALGLSFLLAPHWPPLDEYDEKVKSQSREQANRKNLANSNIKMTRGDERRISYQPLDKQKGEIRLLWLGEASRLQRPVIESQHISIA